MKYAVPTILILALTCLNANAASEAGDDERVTQAYDNLTAYNPDPALGQLSGPLIEALKKSNCKRAARYLLFCAFAFRLKDNPVAAAECARLAMQLDPNNALAASVRVDYLLQSGRFDDAMKLLAATKSLPNSIPSSLLKAHRALAEGKPGRSREILQQLGKENPTDNVIAVRLAGAYMAAGDKPTAAGWFRHAAEGAPHQYQKQMLLAKAFIAENNYPEAKKHLEVAGLLLPHDPFWHITLAILLANEGNNDAIAHFKAAINGSRPSTSAMVKYALYEAHQQDRFKRAHYLLDGAQKMKPYSAQVHQARGLVFRMQGKQSEAVSELEKAVDLNPLNSNTFGELAALPEMENHPEKMEKLAQRWTATCPFSSTSWKALGKALYKKKDYAGAKAAYERGITQLSEWKAEPNWELTRCLLYAGLAGCLFEEKKIAQATAQAKLFNQYKAPPQMHGDVPVRPPKIDFASLKPDSRELKAAEHGILADALYECGNLNAAAKEYEEALAYDSSNIVWHSSVLKVYIDKKDFVAAGREDAIVAQHVVSRLPKMFDGPWDKLTAAP